MVWLVLLLRNDLREEQLVGYSQYFSTWAMAVATQPTTQYSP